MQKAGWQQPSNKRYAAVHAAGLSCAPLLQDPSLPSDKTPLGLPMRGFSLWGQGRAQRNSSPAQVRKCMSSGGTAARGHSYRERMTLRGSKAEPRILRLNLAGQPIEWLNWREGVCLYARDLVAWTLGGVVRQVNGGRSRVSGKRTCMHLPSIMACGGARLTPLRLQPPLTNMALFHRDDFRCMYCGEQFAAAGLSRDHVHPTSRGGCNTWENVVAACKRCNQRKGNFLLSEINMPLQALPYRPNPYEYLALINSHRIRGDQMEYLRPQFNHYTAPPAEQRNIS